MLPWQSNQVRFAILRLHFILGLRVHGDNSDISNASLSGVLPVHLRDDDLAEIDGDEAAVADVEKVGTESGIAAPDDKNIILRLAIPDLNARVNTT